MMEQSAAVQGAARPRPGARPERRGDAQVEGQRHPLRRRGRQGYTIQHELKKASSRRCRRHIAEVSKRETARRSASGRHYPPMSADLIRWLYCRHNPAANINFGPGPAEELRAKFILKLWNTYAFFCNYARLDGFDPDGAAGAGAAAARHRPLDPVGLAAADPQRPRKRSKLQRDGLLSGGGEVRR